MSEIKGRDNRGELDHYPDHNPVRVQGVQRGFGIGTGRENFAFCGALGSCRTWIRTKTN